MIGSSQSYWDGRNGRPNSGMDNLEYELGRRDALAIDQNNYGCLPHFIFLYFILYIDFFIPALITSVLISLIIFSVLYLWTKNYYRGQLFLPFKSFYGIILLSVLAFQSFSFFPIHSIVTSMYSTSTILPFIPKTEEHIITFHFSDYWYVFVFPVLACTGILFYRLRAIPFFKGFPGFFKVLVIFPLPVAALSLFGFYLWANISGFRIFKEVVVYTF